MDYRTGDWVAELSWKSAALTHLVTEHYTGQSFENRKMKMENSHQPLDFTALPQSFY